MIFHSFSLYTAQDGNLPVAFRERTLDFYITLCHRLMKQRSELAEETDQLLRACWSLAEMLFNLRQIRRDNRPADTELLGSAVQACWELCDIFRDGWTKIRPDRGTPRPSQTHFFSDSHSGGGGGGGLGLGGGGMGGGGSGIAGVGSRGGGGYEASSRASTTSRSSLHSKTASVKSTGALSEQRTPKAVPPPHVPETPVTEFEDTPISPQSHSPHVPNIMVLGTVPNSATPEPVRGGGTGGSSRWNSAMSSYSQGSNKTSSTATTTASNAHASSGEDANITRVKALILKAAMQVGFNRDAATTAAAAAQAAQIAGANNHNNATSSSGSSISSGSAMDSDASGSIALSGPAGNSVSTGSTIVPNAGSAPTTPAAALQAFVRGLPTGSFGSLPSHATLLQNYKNLVLADASMNRSTSASSGGASAANNGWGVLPAKGKRVTALDMARSVAWMNARGQHYAFLRDLFRLVFGFQIDEAETKKNVSIVV